MLKPIFYMNLRFSAFGAKAKHMTGCPNIYHPLPTCIGGEGGKGKEIPYKPIPCIGMLYVGIHRPAVPKVYIAKFNSFLSGVAPHGKWMG